MFFRMSLRISQSQGVWGSKNPNPLRTSCLLWSHLHPSQGFNPNGHLQTDLFYITRCIVNFEKIEILKIEILKIENLKIDILKNLKNPNVVMWCVFGDPSILGRETCATKWPKGNTRVGHLFFCRFFFLKIFPNFSQWFFAMKIFEIFPMIFPMKKFTNKNIDDFLNENSK